MSPQTWWLIYDSKHYWPLTLIFRNNTASKGYWLKQHQWRHKPSAGLLNVANVQKHNYIFMWHSVQCLKYICGIQANAVVKCVKYDQVFLSVQ